MVIGFLCSVGEKSGIKMFNGQTDYVSGENFLVLKMQKKVQDYIRKFSLTWNFKD